MNNRTTLFIAFFLYLQVILLSVIPAVSAQTPIQKFKGKKVIIGYVGGYSGLLEAAHINAEKLTHINYAFVNIRNGKAVLENPAIDSANLTLLNSLKQKNPSLKILISIGGWSWSENFSDAVLTDSSRATFAKSAVDIVKKYQLDGVDIDWEYPDMNGETGNIHRPEDKQNYTLMFSALRDELNSLEREAGKKMYLTTATGGFDAFLNHTEMGKAQQYLDYINLMTYDFFSANIAAHHTNLYSSGKYSDHNSADRAVRAYIAAGVPAQKLVMGIAFYGRSFTLDKNSTDILGASYINQSYGAGYSKIKDELEKDRTYRLYRDRKAKAPYLFNSTTRQFVTFDDEWSVKHKCHYVNKHKMAGVMFWEYDSDPKEYLLSQIDSKLK